MRFISLDVEWIMYFEDHCTGAIFIMTLTLFLTPIPPAHITNCSLPHITNCSLPHINIHYGDVKRNLYLLLDLGVIIGYYFVQLYVKRIYLFPSTSMSRSSTAYWMGE